MPSHSTAPDVLDAAIGSYRAVTPGSAALHARASAHLPGGVTSNVKYFPPHPIYLTRAHGSRVVDVDGREYVDYCLAFGPLITGHGHPRVLDAIRAEIERAGTVIFGGPGDLELRLAERLRALLPSAEMVRFTNSGTEATMHALRLARGATGRSRIVKFEGHYHGVHDQLLWNLDPPLPPAAASDGIPGATAAQTIVVPFGDASALRAVLEASDDIAAIIVEPIARGVIEPARTFLEEVRALATSRGVVLIFDEVVVWPRVGLGGAQGLFGVCPDLTALGKALGGGLPLGALAGRRELLSLMAPRPARPEADDRPVRFPRRHLQRHAGSPRGGTRDAQCPGRARNTGGHRRRGGRAPHRSVRYCPPPWRAAAGDRPRVDRRFLLHRDADSLVAPDLGVQSRRAPGVGLSTARGRHL